MSQENYESYLKRKIERVYKQYTGEITDRKSTLVDVAKLFKITIDKSRIADYEIRAINFDNDLSLELVDKKNNTKFKARYAHSISLNKLNYIYVTITNESKEFENIYCIGVNEPIVKSITFIDGEYKLTFEKEKTDYAEDFNANEYTKFAIKYSVDYDKKGKGTCLLSKKFFKHNDGESVSKFEQTQTNQLIAMKENLSSQNKYAFTESDNVMYGIDFFQSDLHNGVKGVLFESTKHSNIKECLSPIMDNYEPSSKFLDENTISAINLMGYVGHGNYSKLEVYKTTEGIVGSYYIKTTNEQRKTSESKNDFQLPSLDEGMITSKEIVYLLENLRSRFGNDFIELISSNLLEFAKKIDIRKGLIEEELEPLSPKLLFDNSIEEIENMVESDKEGYFKLASEQYLAISHQKQEKAQSKVLMPNSKFIK